MKNKKLILIFGILSILILVITFFITKTISKKKFEKNMSEATINLLISAYIAEETTNEYSDIWQKQINANSWEGIYIDGERKYFSNFSEAVRYRINQYTENGVLEKMDSMLNVSKDIMQEIDGSIFGRKESKEVIKALYLDVSDYCALANSPTGSLQSFNNKTSEISSSIERKTRELKLYLPK